MKVSEAFDVGIIPASYKSIVPLKCKCGSDLEVSNTLTRMWCPSSKCDWKQIARMNKMLTSFGVKDIGESYCANLWVEMQYFGIADSHVNVFNLPFSRYPATYSVDVSYKKFNNIQSVVRLNNFGSGMYLGTLVSKLALPDLDINARKLFNGFNSISEFNSKTKEKYGSIYNYVKYVFGTGIMSKKIYNVIRDFYRDIQIAERIFKTKSAVEREIRVSITGRVKRAGRFTRSQYLSYCNDICDGFAEIVDVNPGPSILCVIADEPSQNSTYNYGANNNMIITSDNFVNWLKEQVSDA